MTAPQIRARLTSTGALAELAADGLSLLQYPANELESGAAGIWLRVDDAGARTVHALDGSGSGAEVDQGALVVRGRVGPLVWATALEAGPHGRWAWCYEVVNTGAGPVSLDVVHALDAALTEPETLRRSELFVSQYLDVTPVETRFGTCLAVRQNMPGERAPWLGVGSTAGCVGWASDALQLRDVRRGRGLDLAIDLPSARLQHEHTLATLATPATTLAPGASVTGAFFGVVQGDHPAASGPTDAAALEAVGAWAAALHEAAPREPGASSTAVASVFAPATLVDGDDVEHRLEELVPRPWVDEERDDVGRLLAVTTPDRHVVTARKERTVLRTHAHVAHASPDARPGEGALAATMFLDGVFASQLTRGHASAAPVTTVRRGYLGHRQAAGVRVLVREPGERGWHLLGIPSLWTQWRFGCEWLYCVGGEDIWVSSELDPRRGLQLRVRIPETPMEILVAVAEDHAGVDVELSHGRLGGDEELFADGRSRGQAWRTVRTAATGRLEILLRPRGESGEVGGGPHAWQRPRVTHEGDPEVARLDAALAWFVHDAAVHYQAPRGIEQFTGGAWGTRDVCQGPAGLLIATDEPAALREVVLRVFAGQQDDGDWPQWFDFLDALARPGHRESHGDVVYWPLLLLADYLAVTGDAGVLDEPVRFVGRDDWMPERPVREHVVAALDRIRRERTRDPRLPAYGHGDWNDSLQPARPELAEQMCSTWTTELEIQVLTALADVLPDPDRELAGRLRAVAAEAREALQDVLVRDGELAGYAVVGADGVEPVVHPRDTRTGLRRGSLQMIHAISGEHLTPEDAQHHADLVGELTGPHGVYLFAAPVAYHGGEMRLFKRAEAASFWGREIGLMYTHAHLRWVEALTHLGRGAQAWEELLKVVPLGLTARMPSALPRQATAYFSSAEARFADRYEAVSRARDLYDPSTPVEGGWRVYSSGPGLALRVVVEDMLGIRRRVSGLHVDPVLPSALDGLSARLRVDGRDVHARFHVGGQGCGVERVVVGGHELTGGPVPRRYRRGGLVLPWGTLPEGALEIEVWTG